MNPRECNTAEELGDALLLECHVFWEVGIKIDSQIYEIYDLCPNKGSRKWFTPELCYGVIFTPYQEFGWILGYYRHG